MAIHASASKPLNGLEAIVLLSVLLPAATAGAIGKKSAALANFNIGFISRCCQAIKAHRSYCHPRKIRDFVGDLEFISMRSPIFSSIFALRATLDKSKIRE